MLLLMALNNRVRRPGFLAGDRKSLFIEIVNSLLYNHVAESASTGQYKLPVHPDCAFSPRNRHQHLVWYQVPVHWSASLIWPRFGHTYGLVVVVIFASQEKITWCQQRSWCQSAEGHSKPLYYWTLTIINILFVKLLTLTLKNIRHWHFTISTLLVRRVRPLCS